MNTLQSKMGPLAGLAFAALYVTFWLVTELPEGSYSDERVLESLTDTGKRTGYVVGSVVIALAGVAMLVFVAYLRHRLALLDPHGPLPSLAYGAGLIYVVLLFSAGSNWTGYAIGLAVGELQPPEDTELVRVLNDSGMSLLLIYGLFSAAVLVLASSVSARRSGLLPRWVTTSGVVIAPLLLLGSPGCHSSSSRSGSWS